VPASDTPPATRQLILPLAQRTVLIKNPCHVPVLLLLLTAALPASLVLAANPDFAADRILHRQAFTSNDRGEEGVKFACAEQQLLTVEREMLGYFKQLDIAPKLYQHAYSADRTGLLFQLTTPPGDVSTVDLWARPEMEIRNQLVRLPNKQGMGQASSQDKTTLVLTVSEKEIVLALMQHGRLTEFSGNQCSFQAFRDHVGTRQNIVAWTERLEWGWPDGSRARWNKRFWHNGTPLPGVSISTAVADAFFNQKKYAIGCYTATKLAMIHGVLDYYKRIKNSPAELREIEHRLLAGDNDPLVRTEPRAVWAFEEDFDPGELWQKGKLLTMRYNIPAKNFIPGDWGYFLNTDPATAQKTGYEGANVIYLGRGMFDDYYNDHHHAYLLREKLDEVFQWRNKVFSHRRDLANVQPLSARDIENLEQTPERGGLIMDVRVYFPPFARRKASTPSDHQE
jgi:hypothetical protein